MILPNQIATEIVLRNNTPLDEFLGLSPVQIHELFYNTFSDKSPLQIRTGIDDATLDRIPLFRIAEEYLKIIQRDKQIKLTPLGALPKKIVVELYDKQILPDELIEKGIYKSGNEAYCISIRSARLAAQTAGLVKNVNGKLTLTKAATTLLETDNRLQIFKKFLQGFTEKFLWGINDGYPEEPIGQLGWAFSIMMLDKFGDKPMTAGFYADIYGKAFPRFLTFFRNNYFTVEEQFSRCYGIRVFERFFLWFGFVTVERKGNYSNSQTDHYKGTDIVKSVFVIDD